MLTAMLEQILPQIRFRVMTTVNKKMIAKVTVAQPMIVTVTTAVTVKSQSHSVTGADADAGGRVQAQTEAQASRRLGQRLRAADEKSGDDLAMTMQGCKS